MIACLMVNAREPTEVLHGVGDVVGTDTPGHEETECAGENQEYEAVIRNKRHKKTTC